MNVADGGLQIRTLSRSCLVIKVPVRCKVPNNGTEISKNETGSEQRFPDS